jgi:hypothetical protein
MLSFKIDQIANELFIDTVTELENAFRLAKWVGYKPIPPLPAKAMFMAKINSVFSSDLVLKTPIVVSLDTLGFDVTYELYQADVNNDPIFDVDIVIPAGQMFSESIVGIEGQTRTTNYKSNGHANQIFTLPFENVFHGSIKVKVDGGTWEPVNHFTEYAPAAEYMIEYNAYYKPSIVFGDNVAGLVPPQGSMVEVTCRVPTKQISEIITGAFDTTVFAEVPGVESNVVVQIKNYTKSEFGYPGDQIEDIRKKLPAYLRTQNRCVTGADYKYITDSFVTPYNGGIGKSTIVLRNHGCAGNIVDVVVLAKTGDSRLIKANDNLKKSLLDELNSKKMLTDYICIKDGEIVFVDIHIDAHLNANYRKYESEIRNKTLEIVENYFLLSNWDFGKSLKEKDLIKVLSVIKEVSQFDISFTTSRSVEENTGSQDFVVVRYNEIIVPDTIGINFTYKLPGEL